MKTTKKMLALLLASLMVVGSMSACKSTDADKDTDTDKDTTSDTSKDDDTDADADADAEKPAGNYEGDTGFDIGDVEKFSIYGATVDYNWDNPIAKILTEKTGCEFEFIEVIDDPDTAIALLAAGGDFPDLINNPSTSSMQLMIDTGAYVELEGLIDEYGPNIKNYYGDYYGALTYSKENPHIYAIGSDGQVGDYAPGYYWQEGLFYVQSDVLESHNYPELKTLADYADLIEDELKTNPTMEDGSTRYGLSLNLELWRYQSPITFAAEAAGGLPANGGAWYVDESGEIASTYDADHFKAYMAWLNDMNSRGLIDPESFTQSYDTYISKIANGSCVGNIDAFWSFFSGEDQLRVTYPTKTYLGFPLLTDPDNTEWTYTEPANPISVTGGYSISVDCANPEKIINFYNYCTSEEGYILREWGVEGTNYTVEADGKRVRNAEDVAADAADGNAFMRESGVKLYSRGTPVWLAPTYGWVLSDGQLLSSEDATTSTAGYTDYEKTTLGKYGYTSFVDMVKQPSSYDTVRPYGKLNTLATSTTDDTAVATQKVKDLLPVYISKLITADPAQFETVWAEWLAELDAAGQASLTEEINASYDARIELWG